MPSHKEANFSWSVQCRHTTTAAMKALWAACTHSDTDDAGLCDDLLGQLVEDGVRVVFKGLKFLYPVVQMDVRFKLLVQGVVYCWRPKLDDRVVLLVGILSLSEREQNVTAGRKQQYKVICWYLAHIKHAKQNMKENITVFNIENMGTYKSTQWALRLFWKRQWIHVFVVWEKSVLGVGWWGSGVEKAWFGTMGKVKLCVSFQSFY